VQGSERLNPQNCPKPSPPQTFGIAYEGFIIGQAILAPPNLKTELHLWSYRSSWKRIAYVKCLHGCTVAFVVVSYKWAKCCNLLINLYSNRTVARQDVAVYHVISYPLPLTGSHLSFNTLTLTLQNLHTV